MTEKGTALRIPADPIVVRDFTYAETASGAVDVVQLLTAKTVENLKGDRRFAGAVISSDPSPPGEQGIEVQGQFVWYVRRSAAPRVAHTIGEVLLTVATLGLNRPGGGGPQPSKQIIVEVKIVEPKTQEVLAMSRISVVSDLGTPETMIAALSRQVRKVVLTYKKAASVKPK